MRLFPIFSLVLFFAAAAQAEPFMKGLTISGSRDGQVWGTPGFDAALVTVKDLGVDWVSVHPYAWINTDGSVKFRTAKELGYLQPAVDMAHKRNVQLFWKPHLGYWGRFSWRGEITFANEKQWQRFFHDYTAWIVDHARFAEENHVPLFSIGCELEKTMHRQEWKSVIAAVREVYHGKLTYAANWDGVGRVKFWPLLDYVGVQAYFPLGAESSTNNEFRATWRKQFSRIAHLAGDKDIIFTEVGFARSAKSSSTPWKEGNDSRPEVVALRARLLGIAFSEMKKENRLAGAFWWKWMVGNSRFHADFSMKDTEARSALRRHWKPR